MSKSLHLQSLFESMREMGVKAYLSPETDEEAGFPVFVPLSDGASFAIGLPSPGLLTSLPSEDIGLAILGTDGFPRKIWGFARRSPFLRANESVFPTDLGSLVRSALEGVAGQMYVDGIRYFAGPLETEPGAEAIVLVVNAAEERLTKRHAAKSSKAADALRRVGKALTMNQRLQDLCVGAVHEIASVGELAAALIWVNDKEEGGLRLAASVGVNRTGLQALCRLDLEHAVTCAAELVATSRRMFSLTSVYDHLLTSDVEAQICYLKPGGLFVHPLIISDEVLGIIELIGREDDRDFAEHHDLFATIAEHTALALNSAILFENFEKLASHDALTGIANHRTMQEFLHRRLEEAKRSKQPVGVLMLDVDHFRSFNEEEGHDAGDEVLKLVVEALKATIRPYDLAARYGGEEFTVILPASDKRATLAAAERIRKKVESIAFLTRSGRERNVTVSIGCSVYPSTAKEAGLLLKAADIALFEAKKAGRNRSIFFNGTYSSQCRKGDLDLAKVWEWVPESDRGQVSDLLESVSADVLRLSDALHLSNAQKSILQALLVVVDTYRSAVESGHHELLDAMRKSDEFRLLLPSLDNLQERFDGKGPNAVPGPRIPLLGRVLAVVLSLAEDRGRSLITDPKRFDPEIVSLLTELDSAA